MSDREELRIPVVTAGSSVVVADGLNNSAVLKLQLGNYYEARKFLVSGISLLKDQQKQNELQINANLKSVQSSCTGAATSSSHHSTNKCCKCNTSISNQIASIPLLSNGYQRHFESIDDDTTNSMSETNSSSGENKQKQLQHTEQLKRSEYYNAAFYLPCIETCSSVSEILVVMIFNAALTYHKEGMDGRSSSYHKAMYLYKQILSLTRSVVKSADAVQGKKQQQQQHSSILLVVLATCHNIGYICKEIGQPKLYRSYIDAGSTLERKIKTMSPHDREFFTMNRFFSRYYQHSSAEAA
jgi:hypothetical protein